MKTLFISMALLFTATFAYGREKEDFEKIIKQTATVSKDLSSKLLNLNPVATQVLGLNLNPVGGIMPPTTGITARYFS